MRNSTTTTEATTIDPRRVEMFLGDVEYASASLVRATQKLKDDTDRYLKNLLAGQTGMTPDVRLTAEIAKLEAELKGLVTATKAFQINQQDVEEAIARGTGK